MRKNCLIISLVVIALLICAGVVAVVFIGASGISEAVQNEFTPLKITPAQKTGAPTLVPTAENKAVIPDLAYIKTFAAGYSDDADPEEEGLAIDISFYDSKSEIIGFAGIPIEINIRLFAYRNPLDTLNETNGELVYDGTLMLDHSMKLGEMFGEYIRIPYSEIQVDRGIYSQFGSLVVTVKTPSQGEFSATSELPVALYPSQ